MIKGGALTIPTTTLGYAFDIILNCWEQGFDGYRVYSSGDIEPLEGNLGLSLELLSEFTEGTEWLAQIPVDYITLSSNYSEYQYLILWLAANSRAASQLLQQRGILLALICDRYKIDKYQALKVAEMGQRSILSHFNLESSKAALRFLDKLKFSKTMGSAMYMIRLYLHPTDKLYLRFKHYERVNDFCFFVDRNMPELTGSKLGIALSKNKRRPDWPCMGYIFDTLMLGYEINIDTPNKRVGELSSYQALVELHNHWVQERIRLKESCPEDAHIPYDIPFDDCYEHGIYAVCTYGELLQESAEQEHCIMSYHRKIRAKTYSVFTKPYPKRVTIGISINKNSARPYAIDQVRGYRNRTASEETLKKIYQWFDKEVKKYRLL
ncbi:MULTISPECIES: PcfJ domain-containing protein [unclassified Photobacterium]|uniref:PcfJ domain-containing protein n=1 Tax=unclassified Photobacterium TaxID=2628852 RepID=UPI001EDCE564|nr:MULTISPECIES: PcfJ domain-containing protein [unclassified Photobacterium]MCG3863984.1 PcfJ domain-containing protein [Photobacterium sp. Ph6]MCG3875488.1 PcfJ domain-containing protein [Photobacterium sp. Ph5]